MIRCILRRGFLHTTSASTLSLRSVSRFSSSSSAYMANCDCRPIALQARVNFLIRLSDLDAAAKHARLAPFSIQRTKRCGLFDKGLMNEKAVDWTCGAIVVAMCKAERYKDALDLASYFFVEHKMIPSKCSFNRILKAFLFEDSSATARMTLLGIKRLAQDGEFDEAMDPLFTTTIWHPIPRGFRPFGKGLDVPNSFIRGLLDLGDFEEAHKLFEGLQVRDGYYNLGNTAKFMDYWLKQGKEEEAMECYRRTVETFFNVFSAEPVGFGPGLVKMLRGEPTGTHALLQVLLDYDKKTEAWELFYHLLHSEKKVYFRCDTDTLNLMVNECFKMGRFYAAIHTFKTVRPRMIKKECQQQEKIYDNIIARFCEVGLLYEAERFFAEMQSLNYARIMYIPECFFAFPKVSAYTTLMDAYVKAGRVEDVVRISNQMVDRFLGHVAHLSRV